MADLEAIEAEKDEIARSLGHADRHAMHSALVADPAQPHRRSPGDRPARPGPDRTRLCRGSEVLRAAAKRQLLREGGRGVPRGRLATGLLHATVARRLAAGPVLHQHLPARPSASSTGSHRSRSMRRRRGTTSRSPSRWSSRACPLPDARRPHRGRCLCRGLGPVHRAAGRRDGPVRIGAGALRHARGAGVQGVTAGRRLRAPRHGLDPRAGDHLHARARLAADGRRRDRGRSLHGVAGPGADLQARTAGDRARARRGVRERWATDSTCVPSTTRSSATGHRPWRPCGARSWAGSRPRSAHRSSRHHHKDSTRERLSRASEPCHRSPAAEGVSGE